MEACHTNLSLEREKPIEAMNYPTEMPFSPCLVNGETAMNNLWFLGTDTLHFLRLGEISSAIASEYIEPN